jgi:hypothetical protein
MFESSSRCSKAREY